MIYLITTVHNRESRWNYIRKHLDAHKIYYAPILAPDYRLFQGTEQQQKHQSLTLAYLQIAQMAIFLGIPRYMVLEDDISLNADYETEIMETLKSLPGNWDFLYATKTEHNRQAAKTEPVNDYICKVIDNWWETPITVWNTRMIEEFSERMTAKIGKGRDTDGVLIGNIDHEILKICQEGNLNFYGAEKNLANGLSTARHLADENISFEGAIS